MAKENRMSREEYLKKCEEVEDTAYAQEGNPQTFGNELLLQNINAFGEYKNEENYKKNCKYFCRIVVS